MSAPHNFSWVIVGKLAGSAQPSRDENLAFLRQEGLTDVVSLTEGPLPEDLLATYNLRAYHHPIPDYTAPSLAQALEIVGLIRELLDEEKAVLVHCGAGMGRTGTVLACYLVAEGMTAADAVAHIRCTRPGSIETEAQEALVHSYASYVAPRC